MVPRIRVGLLMVLGLLHLTETPMAAAPVTPTQVPSVLGSVWSGVDSDGDHYTFRFEQNGILSYTSPTGTYRNGTWKQDGPSIAVEINNHYSDYTGTIAGNEMAGTATNVTGKKWNWHLTKESKK